MCVEAAAAAACGAVVGGAVAADVAGDGAAVDHPSWHGELGWRSCCLQTSACLSASAAASPGCHQVKVTVLHKVACANRGHRGAQSAMPFSYTTKAFQTAADKCS